MEIALASLLAAGSLLAVPSFGAPPGGFEVRPGFRIEQVAGETQVESPVAMAFDENGRLFVAELVDYGKDMNRGTLFGRIRVLEDTHGDGKFDRSTIFADHVSWPSGIICYDGGVFVAATPDLLYLKDSHGDGKADIRKVIYTGFGTIVPFRPAQIFNGFCWGMDNRIYVATSGNGGQVRRPNQPASEAVDLRNKDFSFDPRTLDLRIETGTGQFGQSLDDFGQRYVSSNHNHIRVPMYEYRYAARNEFYDMPSPLVDIPADGGAAEVFRISPEEEWRIMRIQYRLSGKAIGPIEEGGKASGYFTSACGVTIYRGDAYPAEFLDNAFVAEPANNLVHRKIIRQVGAGYVAVRADDEKHSEFLRSTDLWFRPVNFANAPDGTLYVADMHRQVIEEANTIPPDIAEKIDFYAGHDRGRIFRVVPDGFRQPKLPHLDGATGAELVGLLEHRNGWYRDTAARLIYERQDKSCAEMLATMARSGRMAAGRIQALYSLYGLGKLTLPETEAAFADPDAHVREHAIRLAEFLGKVGGLDESRKDELRGKLAALVADPAPRVCYQLAFTLGELGGDSLSRELAEIAEAHLGDEWICAAALNSATERAGEFFDVVARDPAFASAAGKAFVGQLLTIIGARGQPRETGLVVSYLAQIGDRPTALAWISAFGAGLKLGGVSFRTVDPDGKLAGLLGDTSQIALDRHAAVASRLSAIQLMGLNPSPKSLAALLQLLSVNEPQRIQTEAIAALGRSPDSGMPAELIKRWNGFSPRVREEAMKILLAKPDRTILLLGAIRDKQVPAFDLSSTQRNYLHNRAAPRVKELAASVIAQTLSNRQAAIDDYMSALSLAPDPAHGAKVFASICAACHRFAGKGNELGPNLATVKNGGKEKLLIDVLDPNRSVEPAYYFYQVETKDSGTLLGTVADETPVSITVKQAWGARTVVPRSNIVKMESLGQSMMPEGLEKSLSKQDLADVLEYIMRTD